MAKIIVSPHDALIDDEIKIAITNLGPDRDITISVTVSSDGKNSFFSYAYYTADPEGEVDISKDPSLGGSYTGVEPMGLFCTLIPTCSTNRELWRLVTKNVECPLKFYVTIYDSHLLYEDTCSGMLLGETVIQRWYMSAGVKRVPIRNGRLRGTLFIPMGTGPFPPVIDLFGSAGGLIEFRASLLASRGFLTLALAFFAYDDLPSTLSEIDLEYFEEAKDFLHLHEYSTKGGVGIVGVSSGGTLALAAATYIPGFTCCVSINGPVMGYYATMHYRERTWKAYFPDITRSYVWNRGLVYRDGLVAQLQDGVNPDSVIEFHKSSCSYLFLFSGDDMALSTSLHHKIAEDMLCTSACDYRIISYPGAGHLLEPPYSPHAAATFARAFNVNQSWGGNQKDHAIAQAQAWNELLKFLRIKIKSVKSNL